MNLKQMLTQAVVVGGTVGPLPKEPDRIPHARHWTEGLARALVSTGAFAHTHKVGMETARRMMWVRMQNRARNGARA